jgi:hypothetical protein
MPLKRLGDRRAHFKVEMKFRKLGLLYHLHGLSRMTSHMPAKDIGTMSPGYIPSDKVMPEKRRGFSRADRKRFTAKVERPGPALSSVLRRLEIGKRLLFRWKQELA